MEAFWKSWAACMVPARPGPGLGCVQAALTQRSPVPPPVSVCRGFVQKGVPLPRLLFAIGPSVKSATEGFYEYGVLLPFPPTMDSIIFNGTN